VAPPAVAAAPAVQSAAATPGALPVTGSSISVILLIGGLLLALGSTVSLLARRTS